MLSVFRRICWPARPVSFTIRPMTLADMGWDESFAAAFAPLRKNGWVPARLFRETSIDFGAVLEGGDEIPAIVAGKLWHEATTDADLPAVGDWVAIDRGKPGDDHVIRALLPRKSKFSRKAPGKSIVEQIIAANVDAVAVVTDAGADDNERRLERYFALIARSGAKPVVVLNKADLFTKAHLSERADAIRALWDQAEVIITSALRRRGLRELRKHLAPGRTLCLVGSSGVGKSTLVNELLGEDWQDTGEVNEVTGKGRHTTTMRELNRAPSGGWLIDNPGMREIQMWTDERTLRESFADVEALAHQCRFTDCKHGKDAGCALRGAVAAGALSEERLASFLRLEDEIAELHRLARKRQMTIERWTKRGKRALLRNFNDRVDHERDQRAEWR